MALKFEDLRVLRTAEALADDVWHDVSKWDAFARDVFGSQFARATDSVGANVAEAFGRYHYGEKLQFLFYARGSLFESKYWLNRANVRQLMPESRVQEYAAQMSETARQINAFANMIRRNRANKTQKSGSTLKEPGPFYAVAGIDPPIFDESALTWIETHAGPVPKSLFEDLHESNT